MRPEHDALQAEQTETDLRHKQDEVKPPQAEVENYRGGKSVNVFVIYGTKYSTQQNAGEKKKGLNA